MPSRFFADESLAGPVFRHLLSAGFDIVAAVDLCPAAPDEVVLSTAVTLQRLVLTEDFDFGGLVFNLKRPALGVTIVNINAMPRADRARHTHAELVRLDAQLLGNLLVIEPHVTRVRKLPDFGLTSA